MRALCRHVVVLLLVLASSAAGRLLPSSASTAPHVISARSIGKKHHKKHKKHAFTSPVGLFIQERASKQLPGPGQHFQFGALVSWDAVLQTVAENPDAKLLLLIRHGQALSNWLEDVLGPDIWFQVESKCSYDDKNGTIYNVFDAELTDLGREQGRYLNSILDGGGWFSRMVGNNSVRAVVSPLSRCLQTAQLVSQNLPIEQFSVEERVRETLGEDTCDARRSASDPDSTHPFSGGPCAFEEGLRTKYPMFEFPIVGQGKGLGLQSDLDTLWTKNRETQKEQVARATNFLLDLWNFAPEKVIVVYTHSGFTRSILLAMGREPYRPQNTELVPAVVIKKQRAGDGGDDHDDDDHDHDHDDHDDDDHHDDHDDHHDDRDHDDDGHDGDHDDDEHHHDNEHASGKQPADGDEEGQDDDEEQMSVA